MSAADSPRSDLLDGRVAIVTGAGRGLGRAHAHALARHGAAVLVNDLDRTLHGEPSDEQPAAAVAREIESAGGQALADGSDVSDLEQVESMVARAVAELGGLDIVVNNAGVLRDRTLANMGGEEWDMVVRVHLRGTFAPMHVAAARWRDLARAGAPVAGRIINTTSTAGLFAFPGQGNYGAAKAGIAALSQIAAKELERYGVTVNAIAPAALTRMTEGLDATEGWTEDRQGPAQVSELVAWLASDDAAAITGRVFYIGRGQLYVARPWAAGDPREQEGGWSAAELARLVPELVAQAGE